MSYLRKYRKSQNLTQVELAAIFGCSPSTIAHCEKGIRKITPANAIKWERLTHGLLSRKLLLPEFFDSDQTDEVNIGA